MKSEVYSWRVSTVLKTELEREARRRRISLSAVLDRAAQDWLSNAGVAGNDAEEQLRLLQSASECFGILSGSNSRRSETVRQTVRERLRRRHGR
jgi:hypothetical protein